MEETESSDFLSSSVSLCSSLSAGAVSNDQVHPKNVGFEVFLSDGLTDAAKAEEDFENVRMIPNSRLSTSDHPVLIRLENEYQARRPTWHHLMGQYCRYTQEAEGRTTYPNKNRRTNSRLSSADHPVLVRLEDEYQARRPVWHQHTGQYCRYTQEMEGRTSCSTKKKLASARSPLDTVYLDKPPVDLDVPQGLKRHRTQDAKSPSNWWSERKAPNLPFSDGDRIFAEKCRELQGFIKPLTDLLNGLKRGRYDRGLSSFQQSLAMDRIQRIVGVLQKPEMGARYLSTLLQVEMMLKVWFPGVTSSSSSFSSSSSLELDIEEPPIKMAKHPDVSSIEQQSCKEQPAPCLSRQTESRPSESAGTASVHSDCVCCKEGIQVLAELPTMNLTWMHTSSICNPPLSQADLHHLNTVFGQDLFGPNGSSCGIIFLVQNGQASTTPTAVSVDSEERPSDGEPEQCSPRTHSAPPIIVLPDSPDLGKLKNHSLSLPYLSARIQTCGGENT